MVCSLQICVELHFHFHFPKGVVRLIQKVRRRNNSWLVFRGAFLAQFLESFPLSLQQRGKGWQGSATVIFPAVLTQPAHTVLTHTLVLTNMWVVCVGWEVWVLG